MVESGDITVRLEAVASRREIRHSVHALSSRCAKTTKNLRLFFLRLPSSWAKRAKNYLAIYNKIKSGLKI